MPGETTRSRLIRPRHTAAIPVGYLVLALLMLVVLLPSALRPPPDQASSAAEFSPDAPPDEQQDSIVAALSRAQSSTAGASTDGTATDGDRGGPGGELSLPAPPPGRGRCYGDPPLQTFSVYSASCSPAFVGDNGGATYPGVSANEFRVAYSPNVSTGAPREGEGPIQSDPPDNESAQHRTLRVYQEWFNRSFEFYGRQMRIYYVKPGSGETEQRAAALRAVKEFDVFAGTGTAAVVLDELARLERVGHGAFQVPRASLAARDPYRFSWQMDGTKILEFGAEFVCKQLAGRPPEYNEGLDPTFDYEAPRKFGILAIAQPPWTTNADDFAGMLQSECGQGVEEKVGYEVVGSADGQAQISTAITKLKAAGVTTVLYAGEIFTMGAFSNAAESHGYHPEWFLPGFGLTDDNLFARTTNQAQWRHAFGISALEVPRPPEAQDWYRAYKEIDPAGTPHALGEDNFYEFLQIANGVQGAGPNLTPRTFRSGLFSLGYRFGRVPWAIGGGYGPGNYSYADDVTIMWWDPTASAPDGQPGAYRYLDGGRRMRKGQIPAGRLPLFDEGVTQADG